MKVFVGGYSHSLDDNLQVRGEGIYCLTLDEERGQLALQGVIAARNPSFLEFSPDKRFLYALEELASGEQAQLQAYKVLPDSPFLELINSQVIPGAYACHLAVSDRQVAVACYGSGNALLYPRLADGSLLPLSQNLKHRGQGTHPERQEGPHVHMVQLHEERLFVVDLGIDAVKAYGWDELHNLRKLLPDSEISLEAGAGPRHMVFHPTAPFAYVFAELNSLVYAFRYQDRFEALGQYNSLPADPPLNCSGAAIRIHPNGRFLYVSNRGIGQLCIFEIEAKSGQLKILGYQDTLGLAPRDFSISPDGRWLLLANQDSGKLELFEVNETTGKLSLYSSLEGLGSPTCVQFAQDITD